MLACGWAAGADLQALLQQLCLLLRVQQLAPAPCKKQLGDAISKKQLGDAMRDARKLVGGVVDGGSSYCEPDMEA